MTKETPGNPSPDGDKRPRRLRRKRGEVRHNTPRSTTPDARALSSHELTADEAADLTRWFVLHGRRAHEFEKSGFTGNDFPNSQN